MYRRSADRDPVDGPFKLMGRPRCSVTKVSVTEPSSKFACDHSPETAMHATNTKYGKVISQELLKGFSEAKQQKLQIERRLRQFRSALLLLHEADFPSEPGTLSLRVEERQSVSFSEEKYLFSVQVDVSTGIG
jgi:hypothetical protein